MTINTDFNFFDLEEGILSTETNISSSDQIHTTPYATSMNSSNYRFVTLKGVERKIVINYSVAAK